MNHTPVNPGDEWQWHAFLFIAFTVVCLFFWWARRGNRKIQDRIRREGFEAGRDGLPVEANPYIDRHWASRGWRESDWLRGWAEGFRERQEADRRKTGG